MISRLNRTEQALVLEVSLTAPMCYLFFPFITFLPFIDYFVIRCFSLIDSFIFGNHFNLIGVKVQTGVCPRSVEGEGGMLYMHHTHTSTPKANLA